MNHNFCYSFPAIKGKQAKQEYFIAMCPLKIIPKLFLFDEEELPPEFRAQRVLNRSRIPEITRYIINNENDYVFSSITASVDGEVEFVPLNADQDSTLGNLNIAMDARFLINDGQHRRAAIEEAIKINSDIGNETISVVFFLDRGLQRSQQMFADLNKHAVNTTKSIGILYDSRDPIAILTKNLISAIPFLKKYTDKENSSLPKYSPKLFTLSNIYNTNLRILTRKGGETIYSSDENFIFQFWNQLCSNIKEWQLVQERRITPSDLRKYYVCSHGVVLESLGMIGNYLYLFKPSELETYLVRLNQLDWGRTNPQWVGNVIAPTGRINKNSSSIKSTYMLIKNQIGLS